MKKKHYIFIFLPIILIIFCIYFTQQPNEGKIIESGSADARVNTTKKVEVTIPGNEPIKTSCFEIENTQNITAVKQEVTENFCVIRAMLIDPIGQITVSFERQNKTNATQSLDDNTGIKLREKESHTYTQITTLAVPKPAGFTQLEQFQTKVFITNTEITGFFLDIKTNALMIVSIHNVAAVNTKVETMFWQIVSSARMSL